MKESTVKKRRLTFLLSLAILLSVLFGCGKKGAAETTLPVRTETAGSEAATTEPIQPDLTDAETDQTVKTYETPMIVNAVSEPQEGDDPLSLSGIENVLRIAYVLGHAENYSVNAHSTVKAKVLVSYTQEVKIYKDYCRGVMLEIDITNSSLVNDAWQTCYVSGIALLRGPDGGKKTWNGRDTVWESDDPEIFSREEFREEYGLFGTELTNYILNADTIVSWSTVTDNGDGTYTQTIKPDLTAATGDCARRMKKMGGLDKYPVFKDSTITLTFDRNWRILSMTIDESYSIKLGILNAKNCRAVSVFAYSYGNADISDYETYFARFINE